MLYIHGIGHYHPANIIDNKFLEDLQIGTTKEWISEKVGIINRRTVLELSYIETTRNKNLNLSQKNSLQTCSETILEAANMALERASISRHDIGMVISGGCAPEYSLPANACVMAKALGIEAICYDISSACSTFAMQLNCLERMSINIPDYVMLIQAENWTTTTDYSDRNTAILVGDAAVVTIVSSKHSSNFKITQSILHSDPSGWDLVKTRTGQHFYQQGPKVQRFAIKKTIESFHELQSNINANLKNHYFIGHQANLKMLNYIIGKLEINKDKHLYNIDQYGNCGSAGAPSVLSQNWHKFVSGDVITFIVVGAGLTWGGLTINYIPDSK